MIHYLSSFLIAASFAFLVACGQKSDIQEGSATFGSAQKKRQAQADAEAPIMRPGSEIVSEEEAPAVKEEEAPAPVPQPSAQTPAQPSLVSEEPESESGYALPPVSVAGAFLSCKIAANELQLACQVMNSSGKALTFNSLSEIEFSYLSIGEAATTFKAFQTSTAGTFFYVDNREHRTLGLLVFKMRNGSNVESLNFSIAPLYVPSLENVRQAVAVDRFGSYLLALPHSSSGRLFGDGNFANENDSCLNLNGANRAKASSFVSTVVLSKGNSQPDLLMENVCGLQTTSTSIVMRGPPPFVTLRVMLIPEAPNLLVAQKVDMPVEGSYTAELDHKAKTMPNNSLDDFTFANFKWGITSDFSTESSGMKIVP